MNGRGVDMIREVMCYVLDLCLCMSCVNTSLEFGEPLLGEFRPALDSLVPGGREVSGGDVVLSDCHSVSDVEYCMPPAAWNEHNFARSLYYFDLKIGNVQISLSTKEESSSSVADTGNFCLSSSVS